MCAGKSQSKDVSNIDERGLLSHPSMGERRTDQIGWRVPAVPTEENDTYWGYSSVPQAGLSWWERLPTRPGTVAP